MPFTPGTFFRGFSEELRRDMVVHPVTMEIAELAGRIEGEQATRGVSIAFEDLLIGPTALHLGYAVVTINVRHFQLIPALLSCNSEPHNVGREGGRRQQKRRITRKGGKPARAWVYAIPEQPDARLFQSILSELDGRFHLQGLAPIPYLFFATDVELNLDIHDRKVLDYWRQRVPARALQAGSATKLDLQVSAIGN